LVNPEVEWRQMLRNAVESELGDGPYDAEELIGLKEIFLDLLNGSSVFTERVLIDPKYKQILRRELDEFFASKTCKIRN
jgi:hypothetical protein